MTRDLVERARKGDHDAFAELAGAAISRLDATAWLMLRDADRATDAVQNALVRAWRDLPTLRDPDRFDAWLRRLVVNACIDEIRRTRRSRFDLDVNDISEIPFVADASSAIADRDQLERAFVRLDPDERAVIV
ncbi:MAG: RNA polymerase sigma factor, partial [Chloroflexota bacterium]